tara:strand:- start:2323 stop:2856 length:534 start_codon:yes stop_codon:yes gene_type:complete
MAHFAKLDENNKVIEVIKVGNGDVDANGGDFSEQAEQWVNNTFKGIFKQTSYNSCNGKYLIPTVTETNADGSAHARSFEENAGDSRCKRHSYAQIGGEYRPTEDVFVAAKTYPSWILDTTQWVYKSPVEYPTVLTYGDNAPYFIAWDEDNLRWLGYDSSNNEFAWDPSSESWSATGN